MTESISPETTAGVLPPAESLIESEPAPTPEFVAVAAAQDFTEGKGKAFKVEGKEVAVFLIGEEFFAIGNVCPHAGAQLCEGFVRDTTVICPWHGWQFDIITGKGITAPGMNAKSFAVKVEDGKVLVATIQSPVE